ncbi:hypothetical protein [Reichenbachiella sp. MSK19-1]|uniref:hypothetical protein n=1 Tax=Reichenbachiella sp. MSK19-1 TaxID=1897631 RepID=UPI0011C40670|nr:hypothetical protein [Reichenbachiella sp. MSK19-1]
MKQIASLPSIMTMATHGVSAQTKPKQTIYKEPLVTKKGNRYSVSVSGSKAHPMDHRQTRKVSA